jgi:DNA-binding LacI/PurR family transcriptional regulator
LTTISQSIDTGAKAMIAALFERIAGVDTPSLEMQPILVRRDTA